MEPAQSIVVSLGGVTAVARYLGLAPSSVSRWSAPIPRGSGGVIPSNHIPKLCKLARSMGLFLEPNHFFRGHL
jgi:hypothetical protein